MLGKEAKKSDIEGLTILYMRNSNICLSLLGIGLSFSVLGQSNHHEDVRFADASKVINNTLQQDLRKDYKWQKFIAQNGNWWAQFNENNHMPYRAMGAPIVVQGNTFEDKARTFISNKLTEYNIPLNQLVVSSEVTTSKHHTVHFSQKFNGYDVLWTDFVVKFTLDGKVIMFGANVFPEINSNESIGVDLQQASQKAKLRVDLSNASVNSDMGIAYLPINHYGKLTYHLVYQLNVEGHNDDKTPSNYYTLVDANNGEILYMADEVMHANEPNKPMNKSMAAGALTVNTVGDLYLTHALDPISTGENLGYLNVTIDGVDYNTDANGVLNTTTSGTSASMDLELSGSWTTILTNGVTPSFSTTINDGANTIDFTGNATTQELSAYKYVNNIHDHCKNWMPSFTGLDYSFPTNIDLTTGSCNAFYNGSSISFYADGGGCLTYANVADVVYHEYGHAINDFYYQSLGSFFQNGALHEAYADWWAISLTLNPILGIGGDPTDSSPAAAIRRYDIDPKVYPVDLVGQVHADGEILCGAWWDTYQLIGDYNVTQQLFVDAYSGQQAATFNGDEGNAFVAVLIDVLQADDDDGDITNGTPNGNAIIEGFAIHGITLISNGVLNHTPTEFETELTTIDVDADLTINFPSQFSYVGDVEMHYSINNSGTWNTQLMNNTAGTNYQAQIPGQPKGTIIKYYIEVKDVFGNTSIQEPAGAVGADPRLPYYILVGFDLEKTHDGDFALDWGLWTTNDFDDNATTGFWEQSAPIPSYADPNDLSTIVQPGTQHTTNGSNCFVTQNAANVTDGMGTADVDGGKTTLLSPVMDLTAYDNPTFTYWRWYTNAPSGGANPGADWFQVYLSDDNGASWVPVEDTKTSETAWRRNAFRVQDYVSSFNLVMVKFIASDSIRPGTNLDGGSLVEAGMDDFQLWDNAEEVSVEDKELLASNLYPNPAEDNFTLELNNASGEDVVVVIYNASGKLVYRKEFTQTFMNEIIDVSSFSSGVYNVQIRKGNNRITKKLKIK